LRAAGPALAWIRSRVAERATVLEAIARRGAPALAEERISGELRAIAGRAARGLLTPDDLGEVLPAVARCDERSVGPSGFLTVPWRDHETTLDAASVHVIAAADSRGLAAIACYEAPIEGIPVPALGLVAPRAAAPVLRGKPRVAPGTPRPSPAPIALRPHAGVVEVVLGVAAAPDADPALDAMAHLFDALPTFTEALAAPHSGRAVTIVCTRDSVRTLASA
jgi:hypothetical protein